MSEPNDEIIKVAVLGGGFGALAAVWGLLNSPKADRYEITLYQMGWRLGGKAASGRNRNWGDRAESTGPQIWSGAYENAFRMMRQVYEELDRAPDAPLSRWYDERRPECSAFLPRDSLRLSEFEGGRWQNWDLSFAGNPELPGSGKALPEPPAFLVATLRQMLDAVSDCDSLWDHEWLARSQAAPTIARSIVAASNELLASSLLARGARATSHLLANWLFTRPLQEALQAARDLPERTRQFSAAHSSAILEPLRKFMGAFEARFETAIDTHTEIRRLHILLDLANALVSGLLEDSLLEAGFDSIDDEDFAAWLERHGARSSSVESAVIRGLYDFVFATSDVAGGERSLSAASALRVALRHLYTFRGSAFWTLQGTTGDTIFAPLYQMLRARGNVRFEFFHKLEALSVSRDGDPTREIQSIKLQRQVDLRDPNRSYDPLYHVKGLLCWPSQPDYSQLDEKQAQTLRDYEIDLESAWTRWPARETIELELGRDFDAVILGIPPAALASLPNDLEANSPAWAEMLADSSSVQTQVLQLWFDAALEQTDGPGPSLGVGHAGPFTRWADQTPSLVRENWERLGMLPRALYCCCGTAPDADPMPDFSAHWFPAEQQQRSAEHCATWLMGNVGPLWPQAALPGGTELDWSKLSVREDGVAGKRRLNDQFWRVGIDPSSRAVLSPPSTARSRLRADESGFENLYLAGDWLQTGLNVGCVEGAVIGGLQASQALSGWPHHILGDEDFIVSRSARRPKPKLRAV